jgi:hypothetical protein
MCVVVNVLVVNITPIVSCQWIQSHVLLQFQKQRGVFLMDFLASRKSSDLANVGALAQFAPSLLFKNCPLALRRIAAREHFLNFNKVCGICANHL